MFNVKELTNDTIRKIDCEGCHTHVEVSVPNGSGRSCVMIKKFMDQFAERVKNMEVYDDDVWVVSFPKCGTTWTQEMVWLVNNKLDYKKAMNINLNERFPFLELNGVLNKFDGDSVGICENMPRPRHIKSHLPIFLLPNKLFTVTGVKIIYVARNPKDVAVSFFHHYRHIVGFDGSQGHFIEAFLKNQVIYAPFNEHVLDFWRLRNEPNVLFLFYEDMKKNMSEMIKDVMTFLGRSFNSREIERLCNHLSVDSMRANPSCNNDSLVEKAKSFNANAQASGDFKFIRKGEIGSFKDELTSDFNQKFDDFMHHQNLKRSQFTFKTNE